MVNRTFSAARDGSRGAADRFPHIVDIFDNFSFYAAGLSEIFTQRHTAGAVVPRRRQAAIRVLRNRQAIVIGPTPPGTGVIAPATLTADA